MIRLQTFGNVLSQPKKYKTDYLINCVNNYVIAVLQIILYLLKMIYDLTINLLCVLIKVKNKIFL